MLLSVFTICKSVKGVGMIWTLGQFLCVLLLQYWSSFWISSLSFLCTLSPLICFVLLFCRALLSAPLLLGEFSFSNAFLSPLIHFLLWGFSTGTFGRCHAEPHCADSRFYYQFNRAVPSSRWSTSGVAPKRARPASKRAAATSCSWRPPSSPQTSVCFKTELLCRRPERK